MLSSLFRSAASRSSILAGSSCPVVTRSVVGHSSSSPAAAAVAYFSTQTGKVKWFNPRKGFGFILPDDGSEDVFVHHQSVHAQGYRALADGEPVEYTTTVDFQGRVRAERVTGPMGAYVQGVPPPPPRPYDTSSGSNYGGYERRHPNDIGGGGGGGYGGGRGRGRGGGGGYQQNEQRSPRHDYYDAGNDRIDFDGLTGRTSAEEYGGTGGGGAPGDMDFHELDLPENELDDNAEAERESSKDAPEPPSAAVKN